MRDLMGHARYDVRATCQIAAANGDAPYGDLLGQAEQVRLLLRLAADSGGRRGELAALQLGDLDGRGLRIGRAIWAEQVSTAKTGRIRRVTRVYGTTQLWHDTVTAW